MRLRGYQLISLLLVSFLFIFFAGCCIGKKVEPTPVPTEVVTVEPTEEPVEEGLIKKGDTVAAPWGGGQYHGTVKEVKGDSADVLYTDDGVTREVKIEELILIEPQTWKVGDRVKAVWSAGKFYEGTIEEVKDDEIYVVKWDDGSAPSDVAADKIIPLVGEEEPEDSGEEEVSESGLKKGDMVAAPWGGGQYHGTIEAVKGDSADVLYTDDGVTREVKIKELVLVKEKTWKVGDKVKAVWSAGKFYDGTIEKDKGDGLYVVKWDDGSAPSDVEAAKIIAR